MASWEDRQVIEAEAKKIEAETEKQKALNEARKFTDAYLAHEQELKEKDIRMAMLNVSPEPPPPTFADKMQAAIPVLGKAVAVHLIWAATIVSVTWIVVVRGWRG